MKKLLYIVLLFLMPVVLALPSQAATSGYCTGLISYDSLSGAYTASYHNAVIGNQYLLLVVDEETDGSYSISTETIEYIDQASANGTDISFQFIPKSYLAGDTTNSCKVLLTYTNGTEPVELGELTGNTPTGATLSGTALMQARTTQEEISVEISDGTTTYSTMTDESGNFSIEGIPDGIYMLTISHSSYLQYAQNITISGDTSVGSLTLLAGDINADQYVNANDLSLVLAGFGQHNITDPVDVTGDTYVNANDLSAVLSSFGKNSSTSYSH